MATSAPLAAATPAAADTSTDDTGTDAGTATDTGDDAGAGDDQGTVLLTVMDMGDGTYKLIAGDEDDAEGGEGAAAGASDETSGAGAAAPADEGKTYDSLGALLKGIMDMVKAHEESAGGEGSADDQFSAGFAGGSDASPAKPAIAQKY